MWNCFVFADDACSNNGKVMYHFVKCAGHGKCRCDAEGGCHKTFCDTAFDNFVTLPEQQVDGKRWAPSHKVESGSIVSLARIVCNILQDDDYVRGARSHSSRKKKEAGRLITDGIRYWKEHGYTDSSQLCCQPGDCWLLSNGKACTMSMSWMLAEVPKTNWRTLLKSMR
jgi:hypothetical protein